MKKILYAIAMLCSLTVFAQEGSVDLNFNPTDIGYGQGDGTNTDIRKMVVQPDGKIIIAGTFVTYNDSPAILLARLNPDGTRDMTFNPPTTTSDHITNVVLQNDKILVTGILAANPGSAISRLNSDGTLDDFRVSSNIVAILSVAVQPDGKIIIGGNDGTAVSHILRVNPNGALDPTFSLSSPISIPSSIAIQPDGKILVGSATASATTDSLIRLNADGSHDTTFESSVQHNSALFTIALQADSKIIVTGSFGYLNNVQLPRIYRLNTNGSIDPSFNPVGTEGAMLMSIVLQPDNKILLSNAFMVNGSTVYKVNRLNTNGSVDVTFENLVTNNGINALGLQSDGKIIVAGAFSEANNLYRGRITRILPDGAADMAFNAGAGLNAAVTVVIPQPDGKIMMAGDFRLYNGALHKKILRLQYDGSPDLSFNPGSGPDGSVTTMLLQPDGKFLFGGTFLMFNNTTRYTMARLNANGSLDNTFNPGTGVNGQIMTTTLQPDGKIIVGGLFATFNGLPAHRLARLMPNGALDVPFSAGNNINSSVYSTAVQPDGKILAGGNFTMFNGQPTNRIIRLESNGSRDNTFSVGAGADGVVSALAVQPDGKILVGGSFTTYNNMQKQGLVRLNPDGSIDTTFAGAGTNGTVKAITIMSTGGILINGSFTMYNGTVCNRVAMLNSDGTIDNSYNFGMGANKQVTSAAVQADGKILIGGDFTSVDNIGRNRIARIIGQNPYRLEITDLSALRVCPGQSLEVRYQIRGSYNAANIFRIELSNVVGNFETPTLLGTFTTPSDGNILVAIPQSTPSGSGYRIRIVASHPNTVSNDNGSDIDVLQQFTYYIEAGADGFGGSQQTVTACQSSQCGMTLPSLATLISTTSIPNVTGYRFRVTNLTDPAAPNQVQILDRSLNWFSLSMLENYFYGTTYLVEVAVKTTGGYSAYGFPCEVTSPALPTLNNCGQTVNHVATLVSTVSTMRAASYRFEFTNLSTGAVSIIDRPLNWFNFNMFAGTTPGAQYNVRVAIMTTGSYSPFGAACTITAPGAARFAEKPVKETAKVQEFKAIAYPNPFTNTFAIDVTTSSSANIQLKVYDMIGKLLEAREVTTSGLQTYQLGDRYPSGVYTVILAQDQTFQTLRVIKR